MRQAALLILLEALALAACRSTFLEGSGDRVTEIRTVSAFDAIRVIDGVHMFVTVDPTVAGDVVLEVTTDSNLQEFLTTEVAGSQLTVSPDRDRGFISTDGFEVSGTVAIIEDVSVDGGARIWVTGAVGDVTLSANNGAYISGDALEAATVEADADNGARISVCATGEVKGEVSNGARLQVLCGGTVDVDLSDGGTVSTVP